MSAVTVVRAERICSQEKHKLMGQDSKGDPLGCRFHST